MSESPADPAPLAQETLNAIAATGVVRKYPKNAVLINEGDQSDTLFIILSGKVKVYASNEAGKEVVIDFHGPGEYVGEMMLDGAPRSASVVTVDNTAAAVVNRAQFAHGLGTHAAGVDRAGRGPVLAATHLPVRQPASHATPR